MEEQPISKRIEENIVFLQKELGIGISFDVISREIELAGKKACMFFIDGFAKDQILLHILLKLRSLKREEIVPNVIEKIVGEIPYIEVTKVKTLNEVINTVLAGPTALLIDGEDIAIIIDAREYPARYPEEPDIEKVTRGPRDGFVETIVFNTALIRRRIRDPRLRIEMMQVGKRSKTDVAVAYIQDIANPEIVQNIKKRIGQVIVDGLPMGEKSLEEMIIPGSWNPFPQVRYTERPDVAAIHLLEGHVAIIVDTSPSVILAPVTFFHHLQHAEEYRQNAAVGAYLRWVRFLGVIAALVVSPLWLGLVLQNEVLPRSLQFIGPNKIGNVPLFLQLLIAEVGIDLVRLASIHTPSPLATALGIIAAFMIGEVASDVGLLASEIILYMAIAAVGTFAIPSYEMSMAIRLIRLFLIVLVILFKLLGLVAGLIIFIFVLALTKSFGLPYLWPLLPLNMKALLDIFIRRPVPLHYYRPSFVKPIDNDRRPAK